MSTPGPGARLLRGIPNDDTQDPAEDRAARPVADISAVPGSAATDAACWATALLDFLTAVDAGSIDDCFAAAYLGRTAADALITAVEDLDNAGAGTRADSALLTEFRQQVGVHLAAAVERFAASLSSQTGGESR
ncbi:hypothetical protein ACFXHA_43570 [Nocardia sp. NPDC059240]|uniref:hypothetical protein n=1 Tax=Nocardia sp. NPDC059240 TaxID=3346786 RepID=UPI0036A0D6E1